MDEPTPLQLPALDRARWEYAAQLVRDTALGHELLLSVAVSEAAEARAARLLARVWEVGRVTGIHPDLWPSQLAQVCLDAAMAREAAREPF